MQPFFVYEDGILWTLNHPGPWIQLGVNCVSILSIIIWASIHSFAIFGTLKYFGMLRVDLDTELQGSDITKHGEDAYQVIDWGKANLEAGTQTALTMNNKNVNLENQLLLCQQKQPTDLNNRQCDYIMMDNLKTILQNCKI